MTASAITEAITGAAPKPSALKVPISCVRADTAEYMVFKAPNSAPKAMMVAINDVGPDSSEATPIVLAGQEVTPRALLVEANEGGESAIYFTTFAALGGVKRVAPGSPGQVTTIAADQAYPNGLAVDATHVYWTNRGDGTVKRMPKGGAPGEPPTVIATGQVAPGPIVVDETHVYWANEGTSDLANGSIMKIQKP